MRLRTFWEFAMVSMRMQVMYKPMFWAAFFGNLLWLIVTASFWHAAYQSPDQTFGISYAELMTYLILAMMLYRYTRGVGGIMSVMIRDGSIATELMRPYHVMFKFFAMDVGSKIIILIRETIPMFLVIYFLIPFQFANWQTTLWFLLSVVMGMYLAMIWDLIVDMLSFWLINMWGVYLLYGSIVALLSGALIPFSFFPDWFSQIKDYLPFPSMIYTPTAIYTGQLTNESMLLALTQQFQWILISVAILMVFWRFAIKRLNVHGG